MLARWLGSACRSWSVRFRVVGWCAVALASVSPLLAQTAVGPIAFDEGEFPTDQGLSFLEVSSLDGVPIPTLRVEAAGGFVVPSTFLSDLGEIVISSMGDPILYADATEPVVFDFGGDVSGVAFDAQVLAFGDQSVVAGFLTGTLVFRALGAAGGQVGQGSVAVPFDALADPLVIGQSVSFSSPSPFRRLEISVELESTAAFSFLALDNLAYGVSGEAPVELFDEVGLSPTGTLPAVATDLDGRRALTWLEPGRGVVLAQVIAPDDAPLSSVFIVNSIPAVGLPAVVFDASGNLVFAWQRGASVSSRASSAVGASSIVARSFSPMGAAQTGEVVVSQGSDATAPSIDSSSGGESVVTWESGGKVRARKLDRGLAAGGPTLDVSDGAGQVEARVATAASGEFAVAWVESVGGTPAVYARLFRADGSARTPRTRVSAQGGAATRPSIASDALGNVVIVWQQAEGSGFDVLVRRFDANGAARGTPQRVHSSAAGDQTAPSVAANSNGDFVVAWESNGGASLRFPVPSGRPAAASGGGTSIVARGFNPGGAGGAEVEVASVEAGASPGAPQVSIGDDDGITVVFERRGGTNGGAFSRRLETPLPSTPCVADAHRLCLADGRFSVRVSWRDFSGNTGVGNASPLTPDTGAFWFFEQANIEIVVKVLDARGLNGFFWVFYGALSNVEYTLIVDDSVTGRSSTYFNPLGAFGSVGDTSALPGSLVTVGEAARLRGDAQAVGPPAPAVDLRMPAAVCANTAAKLCLQQSRFEVSVTWRNFQGQVGGGTAIPLTADTGYFWFFDDANVELVVKVLDARGFNGRFWVFYGALSNVEYTIIVRDTVTGATKTYVNPLGSFGSVGDTTGLPGAAG